MSLGLLARRPNTMFTFSKVRRISMSSSIDPPETCYIMGRYGKIPFDGKRWGELGDFLQYRPILQPLPSHWLCERVDSSQPYMINDSGRYLLRSALFLPYFANELGKSYSGAFRKGNVGVIRDMRLLAFRELNEDIDGRWLSRPAAGYNECSIFLKDVISQCHPTSIAALPTEMDRMFYIMDCNYIEGDFLMYDSMFLPDEAYGYMSMELWKFLRKRCPQLGKHRLARQTFIAVCKATPGFLDICQSNAILNGFLSENLRNPAFILNPSAGAGGVPRGGPISSSSATGGLAAVASAGSGNPSQPGVLVTSVSGHAAVLASSGNANSSPSGGSGSSNGLLLPTLSSAAFSERWMFETGIEAVDASRHGSVHSDDPHLRELLKLIPGECAKKLKNVPLGNHVIRVFRYLLPMYQPSAFEAIWSLNSGDWEKLGMRRINPIPAICSADPEK